MKRDNLLKKKSDKRKYNINKKFHSQNNRKITIHFINNNHFRDLLLMRWAV